MLAGHTSKYGKQVSILRNEEKKTQVDIQLTKVEVTSVLVDNFDHFDWYGDWKISTSVS